MRIDINNLQVKNYKINATINDNEKIGVFARSKELVTEFLEKISGINKNGNTIFLDNKSIYDNKDYFSKRVYFDFSKKYLTTLRANKIETAFKNYKLNFNKENFEKIVNELNIRGETDITYKHQFTEIGNSLANLALLCSLDVENIIVNNSTANLRYDSDFEYFSNSLTGPSFNNVILGIDNLAKFKNKLDKIMIFTDFGEVVIVEASDSLICLAPEVEKEFLVRNKLFLGEKLIAINTNTKQQLKSFQASKFKYDLTNIYDVEKFIGEK